MTVKKSLIVLLLVFFNSVSGQQNIKLFYDNGNLASEGQELDGKRMGDWSSFFEDGSLKSMAKYKSGFVIQKKEFYKTGEVSMSSFMLNGTDRMQTYYYFKNGNMKKQGAVNANKLETGEWLFYNEKGDEVKTVVYDNGQIIH